MNALTWNGSVLASGFVFDEALIARPELVKRLLGAWSDRARLGRVGTRWYLLGVTPRQVDSRACIGAPLVLSEGRWLMGPAANDVVRAAPTDSILECVAGERRVTSFSSLTAVHPSELIELALPSVLEVKLLAPPPEPAVPRRAEAPTLDSVFAPMLGALAARSPPAHSLAVPPRPSLREQLGQWIAERERRAAARPPTPSLGSRLGAFFSSLASRAPTLSRLGSGREEPARPPTASLGSRLGAFFSSLASRAPSQPRLGSGREELDVRRLRQPPATPREPSWFDRLGRWFTPAPGSSPPPPPPPAPREPGFLDRFGRWLSTPSAPTAPRDPPPPQRAPEPGWLSTTFRNLFGPKLTPDKQREYLDDLRRRFDMGDLAEALRRAIPLGGGAGGITGVATSLPGRRDTLSLFGGTATGAPAMVMPNDEFAAMKKLYRESADALIARGQIEEAAFVLAKLLHDGPAAVALLEKHGKLELAAQLATVQHLPEVERIRLWLLLGRKDEAIRIARNSNDFGALVQALTTRAPELARQLRGVWGDFLADRQRFTEAIVVTAPLTELPERWEEWVTRSLEVGGAAAATALAVDASKHPEHAQETRARVSALLAEDDRAQLTTTTAEAFLKHAPAATGPLYRDLWRRLMRDASEGRRVDRALADRVMKAAGDQTLAVDAVPSAPVAELRAREPLELAPPVVPSLQVFDVAPLPKGRRALALGSAGLRIVSAKGETIRHQLVKADLLVAGPVGLGVLVLSIDGDLTRCWRLDPRTFELTSWFQGRLSAFSRRYDGLCWAVGMESSLIFLDPSAAGPMEWWRVPNVECRAIDASGSRVIALATELGTKQSWRYVFNASTELLQVRHSADMDCWVRGETALPWEFKVRANELLELSLGARKHLLPAARWSTFAMEAGLVLVRVTDGDTEVRLVPWTSGDPFVVARLSRTVSVQCRDLSPTLLALCDEHGRVTEVDLS